MIAGNHDTPRAAETGCILRLFAPLGIHVVDREPQRLTFPDRDLSILAVPDALQRPSGARAGSGGEAQRPAHPLRGDGMLPADARSRRSARRSRSRSRRSVPTRWSYVALGHYHVYRQLAPNVFYSGSIEYTSLNMWGELRRRSTVKLPGKGMIEYDLATGKRKFHLLPATRPLVDLPPIIARAACRAADSTRRSRPASSA